MIVDPDFLDHWRTRMLVDALGGDEMAPMCLLRLWAHCQVRRADRFEMPAAGLKAQCRYTGDAALFEQALIEGKYIARHGDEIEVLGWAEQNASLLAAWENGNKGGRPRKEPKQNPRVTDGDPTGNPAETQGKPIGNPALTHREPIREEKRREEASEANASAADAATDPDRFTAEQAAAMTKEELWSAGKSLLASAKVPKAQCGSFIGALVKEYTAEVVIDVVRAAVVEVPADPRGWMRASCQTRVGKREPAQSFRESDLKAKRAEVAAWSGGILGRDPADTIDMEPTHGALEILG